MDDFGCGYSSLNTLKDYKFDELKIDMGFLSNFNETSRTIIRSTVCMAKNLGIKTLAEGVETREQMEFLKKIGCEKVQGYFYGKPQPLDDTLKHMEEIGMQIEKPSVRKAYSQLGRLDYLVDTPKAIMEFKNGKFKFLFVNEQYEEQLKRLGLTDAKQTKIAANDPSNPAYYALHEAEKAAYEKPSQVTYATRGTYLTLSGRLITEIEGSRIYDVSVRNTHVSVVEN